MQHDTRCSWCVCQPDKHGCMNDLDRVGRCGGCTLCCTLVAVAEIGKRPFLPCAYLEPIAAVKPGCAIYEKRPPSCRHWSCQFVLEGWDEELRPDRCGIVFDPVADIVSIDGREVPCLQAWVRPGLPLERLQRQPIAAVVMAATHQGYAVLFRLGARLSFTVWREDGKLVASAPAAPQAMGDEAARLDRAAALVERMEAGRAP